MKKETPDSPRKWVALLESDTHFDYSEEHAGRLKKTMFQKEREHLPRPCGGKADAASKEADPELLMIDALLRKPMSARMNWLRKRLPGGGSCI